MNPGRTGQWCNCTWRASHGWLGRVTVLLDSARPRAVLHLCSLEDNLSRFLGSRRLGSTRRSLKTGSWSFKTQYPEQLLELGECQRQAPNIAGCFISPIKCWLAPSRFAKTCFYEPLMKAKKNIIKKESNWFCMNWVCWSQNKKMRLITKISTAWSRSHSSTVPACRHFLNLFIFLLLNERVLERLTKQNVV